MKKQRYPCYKARKSRICKKVKMPFHFTQNIDADSSCLLKNPQLPVFSLGKRRQKQKKTAIGKYHSQ